MGLALINFFQKNSNSSLYSSDS